MGPVFLATCRNPPVPPTDDPLLAAALEAHDWQTISLPWTELMPAVIPPGSAVILRSTWDYHLHPKRFLCWLSACEKAFVTVLNPPSLVRLTIDKSYLVDQRPFGCPAPVTIRVPSSAQVVLHEVKTRGWMRFIIKPLISASADGTFLLTVDDTPGIETALKDQPPYILLQEFLPEIRAGELSFIFFDGRFSHAVRKIPAACEYRVQSEFGSHTERCHPPTHLIGAARRILSCLPEMPCYARVDGVIRNDALLLMELELIEPELFLSASPGAAAVFANSIIRQLTNNNPV